MYQQGQLLRKRNANFSSSQPKKIKVSSELVENEYANVINNNNNANINNIIQNNEEKLEVQINMDELMEKLMHETKTYCNLILKNQIYFHYQNNRLKVDKIIVCIST